MSVDVKPGNTSVHDIFEIKQFLCCQTPDLWLEAACANLDKLLIDHAHCERKAAATAIKLMFEYTEQAELQNKLTRLAREELLHFEQVLKILSEREIAFVALKPGRYAKGLRKHIRTFEPGRLIDTLIVGAYIEARSCERFSRLTEVVDERLARYYRYLLKSESRHFEDYLQCARNIANTDIGDRINFFGVIEQALIESPDEQFCFHSGPVIL